LESQSKTAKFYFDKADVLMIVISNHELVEDINQAALQILGYSKDEILGKNWFDNFVEPKSRESIKRLFHETLNSTIRHVHFEQKLLTKQGQTLVLIFIIYSSDAKAQLWILAQVPI
jgi:PAS domain S-box-containing protein